VEYIENLRSRYDGEKRNPWDEAECGHHYARAMSSWTGVVALSGFQYDGAQGSVIAVPRVPHKEFQCFWSTGTGWGTFSYRTIGANGARLTIKVLSGRLPCRSIEMTGAGLLTSVMSAGQTHAHSVQQREGRSTFRLQEMLVIPEGSELGLEVHS
jgi:hypothetical protein